MLNIGTQGKLWGFNEIRQRALKGEKSECFLRHKNKHAYLAFLKEVQSQQTSQVTVLC